MATDIRDAVRDRYRQSAVEGASRCGPTCCGSSESKRFGYSMEELAAIPTEADLALGCGNPTAIAGITEGETVLDLGSGGGIDCFLAAKRVGPNGRVIGVDMTPEMISRARQAASQGGYDNVEFRLGEIENIPVADNQVDLVISNCVVNLSPDKGRVFAEAYRVLKPGGRLSISDPVVDGELPESARASMPLLTGCISGALTKPQLFDLLASAGFKNAAIELDKIYAKEEHMAALAREAGVVVDDLQAIASVMRSITYTARKPWGTAK